jgi:hypothetical protein
LLVEQNVDITLGPEMKSTGEVMGKDQTLEKALYKGLTGSGFEVKDHGTVSPVDFISGPKVISTFFNLLKLNTGALTNTPSEYG